MWFSAHLPLAAREARGRCELWVDGVRIREAGMGNRETKEENLSHFAFLRNFLGMATLVSQSCSLIGKRAKGLLFPLVDSQFISQ